MAIIRQREYDGRVLEADIDRYPFLYECDKAGCIYRVVVRTIDEGYIQQARHWCRRKDTSVNNSQPTLLESLWAKLDEDVRAIMAGSVNAEYCKAHASGLSEAIALLHAPYFETKEEVSREALKRHKEREAGNDYETPGLGSRRNELPPGYRVGLHAAAGPRPALPPTADSAGVTDHAALSKRYTRPERVVANPNTGRIPAARKPAGPKHDLPPETVALILERSAQGFTMEMLAMAYNVSEVVIKRIIRDGM